MIVLLPVLLVDRYWPQVKDGMAEACLRSGGQYTQDWLHGLCRRGEAYFVADIDDADEVQAAVVCQNQNWTGTSVLFLHACWGRPYKPDEFIAFAKEAFQFDTIKFEGRPGWQKTPGVKVVRMLYDMKV